MKKKRISFIAFLLVAVLVATPTLAFATDGSMDAPLEVDSNVELDANTSEDYNYVGYEPEGNNDNYENKDGEYNPTQKEDSEYKCCNEYESDKKCENKYEDEDEYKCKDYCEYKCEDEYEYKCEEALICKCEDEYYCTCEEAYLCKCEYGYECKCEEYCECKKEIILIMPFSSDFLVSTLAELEYAVTTTGAITTIILQNDILVSNTLVIPAGQDRILAGNHFLIGNGTDAVIEVNGILTIGGITVDGDGDRTIRVNNGGTLNLESGSIGDPANTNNPSTGGGVYVSNGGTFNMYGGYVQNNTAIAGGGVLVGSGGTFNMTAGYIQNNFASGTQFDAYGGAGGGVLVHGADALFNMSGGYIRGNSSIEDRHRAGGGGVALRNIGGGNTRAVFNMTGGTIYDNFSGAQGGGVTVHRYTTFNLNGGQILENQAMINGGGVAVWGEFNMISGLIDGNNALGDWTPYGAVQGSMNDINGTGGGVFIGQNMGIFEMTGGTISNNTASNGGGIGMSAQPDDPPQFIMHGGYIVYNRAVEGRPPYGGFGTPPVFHSTGHGGGVYMRGSGYIHIENGLISGNEAAGNGGGFKVRNISPYGSLTIINGEVSNNTGNNGGGIYTALSNVDPGPSQYIYVHANAVFTGNYARNGLSINTPIADANNPVIYPYTVTVTYIGHAFTNHDMFVPTQFGANVVKIVYDADSPVVVGDSIVYRIAVSNSHTMPLTNLIVRDDLRDVGLTFNDNVAVEFVFINLPSNIGSVPAPYYYYDEGTGIIEFTIPELPIGASLHIFFEAIVDRDVEYGVENSIIQNTATLIVGGTEVDYDTAEIDQLPLPPLEYPAILKTANNNTVQAGGTIIYTITVTNPNNTTFSAITVTDPLNSYLSLVSGSVQVNGNAKAYELTIYNELIIEFVDGLSPNGIYNITFSVIVSNDIAAGTAIPNTATLDGEDISDPPSSSYTVTVPTPNGPGPTPPPNGPTNGGYPPPTTPPQGEQPPSETVEIEDGDVPLHEFDPREDNNENLYIIDDTDVPLYGVTIPQTGLSGNALGWTMLMLSMMAMMALAIDRRRREGELT